MGKIFKFVVSGILIIIVIVAIIIVLLFVLIWQKFDDTKNDYTTKDKTQIINSFTNIFITNPKIEFYNKEVKSEDLYKVADKFVWDTTIPTSPKENTNFLFYSKNSGNLLETNFYITFALELSGTPIYIFINSHSSKNLSMPIKPTVKWFENSQNLFTVIEYEIKTFIMNKEHKDIKVTLNS